MKVVMIYKEHSQPMTNCQFLVLFVRLSAERGFRISMLIIRKFLRSSNHRHIQDNRRIPGVSLPTGGGLYTPAAFSNS